MKNRTAALGIDCGGTNIKIALVKKDGKIIDSALEPMNFKQSPEKAVSDMAALIKKFMDRHAKADIESVGMGIAGEVDQAKGVVRFSPNLGWKNVPLKSLLARNLKIKIFAENDANCAAWGAYCLDARQDCGNLICLTLGTGVGGGIVINRKLYRGSTGSAGEIGHMTVRYNGRPCKCGNFGCIESYVGAWGLVKSAEEGMKKSHAPILKKLLRESGSRLSPRLLQTAAEKKDPLSLQIWKDAGEQLGSAMASLVNIFNPDRIVLCGGVSKAGSIILDPAQRALKARAFKTPGQKVKVTVSKYDQNLGVAGAALLFWE